MKPETISIVIPVKNEEETIQLLLGKLDQVTPGLENISRVEIIFVDDGSDDKTPEVIKDICLRRSDVKFIRFRKNYGKSAALAAGFAEAKGDYVVTMDGDLQDEPTELPKLLAKIREGFDLVSGWKRDRNDPMEKVIPSRIFNFVVSRLTGVRLHDFNCGYKIYRSWCVKGLKLTGNLYRFLPVFVDHQGGKVAELPVKHNPRKFGVSKYGFKRYFHGMIDLFTVILLTKFLSKPTYFFGLFALPLIAIGTGLGLYLLAGHIYWIISGDISYQLINRPLLIIAMGLAGFGINIFLVGLLGEFILSVSSSHAQDLSRTQILEVVKKSDES